ncbi:hypothetical protein [Kosakonia sp. 1610]|uniref:hypothetical protein n=1 Tax=Kosakonia sp. 1610 TaxID=3156426 RepID=UPI003D1D177B
MITPKQAEKIRVLALELGSHMRTIERAEKQWQRDVAKIKTRTTYAALVILLEGLTEEEDE